MNNRGLHLLALFATIAVLWLFMFWLQDFDFGATANTYHPKSLAATGFIILAAFSMGEFFKLLKIPALLGYIAAGVLFGPNLPPLLPNAPEALFSTQVISDLSLVNVLTVGVIGTMGGGELKISDIKDSFKTIAWVVGLIFVIVVPTTFSAVLILADHFPTTVPFLQELSQANVYAAALMFAIFGLAMSPAATLAILQETRAKGKFTSLVLGIVIVMDLVLVASFLLVLQFDLILIDPAGFNTGALVEELPKIAAEFGYAIVIGVVTGLVFILYLRFVRREQLFFTVAIIFATAYVAKILHAETLAAFLTAGFIVQNFSKHGHDMIHALEKISLPVFVIYFMTQAAILDLAAIADYVWLTAVLTVVRGVALYLGSRIGAELAGADRASRRYLWLGLFSRGGVDLVLAAMVGASAIPWGTEVQTVVMAVVVVHIVGGPPVLKLALDWAGETEGSRRQTREEAEAFDQLPSVGEDSSPAASFPVPDFADPELDERVASLRELLVELHRDYIAEPLEAKAQTMRESLEEASDELGQALDKLQNIVTSDEFKSPKERCGAVAKAHIEYLHDIADDVETWEEINPEIVHHERVFELIAHLRNREEFAAIYRVDHEDFLYDPSPDDHLGARLVKALRRVRRSMLGTGARAVPLGRLWRYYVELTVPRYLARAADATAALNERFWTDLGNHMRRVDDLFDDVFDAVAEPVADEIPGGADISGEIEREPRTEAEAVSAAQRILSEGREEAEARERALDERLNHTAAMALDRYTVSLRETFARFLDATRKAGTIELPQFRYRPSLLFDRSRRAEAQIESRLEREHTVVTGQRGWIVAEWQLVLFLYWLETYEDRARETLESMVANPISAQLDVLRAACMQLPPAYEEAGWSDLDELRDASEAAADEDAGEVSRWPVFDWEAWLTDEVHPTLERTRANLQRMLALYAQGHAARRLLEMLELRVAQFSGELVLLSEHPDQIAPDAVVPTLQIPLREWFVSEVVRETALRLVEFNERGETIVRDAISVLEDVQQVVEFNLLTAHRDAAANNVIHSVELATGGLERAARMLDEVRESHVHSFGELTAWIVGEANDIAERAAEPFLEHRPAEIERLMARRGQASLAERGESLVMATVNKAVGLARSAYRKGAPIAAELAEELRALFVEDPESIANADIRRRLHPDERTGAEIPAIYRRLFTPVPLDIPDFYVSRPDVEARLVQALGGWGEGRSNSVLIYGDRGVGKRSTLHHVMHQGLHMPSGLEDVPVHTVLLDDDLQTEAELVQKLGTALPNEPAETMEGLVRFIEVIDGRHIVVIEHGEKLFSRTDRGLETCRRFLRAMNETTDNILWVVLMGRPAVTLLDTAIGVLDFFTHAIEIGPLSEEGIDQMIQKRHRVSGFRANFRRDRPRIRDWVGHPVATSEALRDPRAEYLRDLAHLSGGNPMLALLYWLESCSLDEADDHLIWVDSLPDREPDLVAGLSLVKRLILAALVQHHTLTPLQLRSILRRDFDEVQTELEHLRRLGFVSQIAGRQVTVYRLRSTAEGIVTSTLRDMNMI